MTTTTINPEQLRLAPAPAAQDWQRVAQSVKEILGKGGDVISIQIPVVGQLIVSQQRHSRVGQEVFTRGKQPKVPFRYLDPIVSR